MIKKNIKLILLGLDFNSSNFGCVALAYSFLYFLQTIAEKNRLYLDITSVNYNEFAKKSDNYNIKNLKIQYKSIHFYRNFIYAIKDADFVFDFTGGDSFTDMYGNARFVKETFLKQIAVWCRGRLILGPQTIGPFKNRFVKGWASHILKKSLAVFVRDKLSLSCAKQLGCEPKLTTDVAFSLPADDAYINWTSEGNPRIGINVSALMWYGGYSQNNSFYLKLNYRRYCKMLIENCLNQGFEIFLISHVMSSNNIENDYQLCVKLHDEYPNTILAPKFENPMQAKAYMSGMHCLIGSRMHATIGAFSMGVPTISVSYSRKFQGLYDAIDYPYVLDAKKMNENDAIKMTLSWINDREKILSCLEKSLRKVEKDNIEFRNDIEKLLLETC